MIFKVVVPPATTGAATARKPAYVSPATQSIAVSFTPASGPVQTFNQDLTPASNPSCVASLASPAVCTVTFTLAAGAYTASFATYDGLLDGSNNPTGNVLSQNQSVPVTIVAGQANTLNVTLQGVPASVVLIPGPASTLARTTTNAFSLSKCFASQSVSVIGVDADGNYIIGPGVPVPSLVSSDTTHVAVTAPSATSPNTFTLTRPAIPDAGATVTLTATATPGSGGSAPISASLSVTFDTTICGTFTEYALPTAGSFPAYLAVGSDGALWFAEAGGRIGRITTAGTISEFTPPSSNSEPSEIVSGPDGALWFTEFGASNIGRITTGGAITEFPTPSYNSEPGGITSGSDGALWFTEGQAPNIGRITTAGSIVEYPIPGSVNAGDITAGSDGALWFTLAAGIGRITTAAVITTYAAPGGPEGITSGPDGNLWFTENGPQIQRISPSGTITGFNLPDNAVEEGIAAGPDGAIWFSDGLFNNAIGRITTAGVVTEYTVPTANSIPWAVRAGPDGAIWFTEDYGNKIGRLQ